MRAVEIARRVRGLGTEQAFDFARRAREIERAGRDVVHLEFGEPDAPTPAHVVEAGVRALREGHTRYEMPAGWPPLREAIAEEVSTTRGVEVGPDRIVVLPGAKPAMFFAALSLLEEGDEGVYPDPGFPIYPSVIGLAGAKAVPWPIREENGFLPDLGELRALLTPRTRLLFLNSPHNPTGAVLPRAWLEGFVRIVRDRSGIAVVTDEIYSRLLYDEAEHVSPLAFDGMGERTVVIDGFSKTHAMTGWRLGFAVVPPPLAPVFERLVVNAVSCTPSFTQRAGLEAIRGPREPLERMREEFRRRRDAFVEGLNAIPGARCTRPLGGFCVFPNVREAGLPSERLAWDLLEEEGVACVPGSAFGARGEGYLRFACTVPVPRIGEALHRIARLLERRRVGSRAR
ncbi:MAG TPA: pyridoxal phosphate-dependent aminotransferase [Planctomycetota bacterium]|jgi:aspartate/methionine/tyrosine aminotransferase|nr:pyridoxal phosphate-dependent aminotransferase [Planctomycetota bacterium]